MRLDPSIAERRDCARMLSHFMRLEALDDLWTRVVTEIGERNFSRRDWRVANHGALSAGGALDVVVICAVTAVCLALGAATLRRRTP